MTQIKKYEYFSRVYSWYTDRHYRKRGFLYAINEQDALEKATTKLKEDWTIVSDVVVMYKEDVNDFWSNGDIQEDKPVQDIEWVKYCCRQKECKN